MASWVRILAGLSFSFTAWPALAQSPTFGFAEYQSTFNVQKPYDIPVEQRFSDTGGMYTTKVYPTDNPFEKGNSTAPRTEMRWETWTNQNIEHMFEADVMYESGCARTCIMQIKSNTSGEAVYLRVVAGGDLIWLGNGATVRKAGYGTWFNLKAAYNPSSKVSRVWIDNVLKATGHYSGGGWYFKNGTYTVEGKGPAIAHFKNIKLRIPGLSAGIVAERLDLTRASRPQAILSLGNGTAILPSSAVDLRGRAAARATAGIYLLPQARERIP